MSLNRFFHGDSAKNLLITAGVVLAILIFLLLATRIFVVNKGWPMIFAVPLLLATMGIVFGWEIGYSLGKVVLGLIAIVIAGGVFGPFTYADFLVWNKKPSYWAVLIGAAIFEAILLLLIYSLEKHQRLRRLKSDD